MPFARFAVLQLASAEAQVRSLTSQLREKDAAVRASGPSTRRKNDARTADGWLQRAMSGHV